MSVKIRLTRIGRHKDAYYRIVAADSRMSRDGRYIEQIGTFDPADDKLGEAVVTINEELALKWLSLGAIPSPSVRTMFSEKGILAKFAESKVKKSAKKETTKKEVAKKKVVKKESK